MTNDISLAGLEPDQLLDPGQAGAILGVEPSTLAVWRSVGRYSLKYIKVGRLVRYRAGDLAEWLEKRARMHTGDI